MAWALKCEQKHLGPVAFFVCVMAINLIAILAIDMYAPALSGMQQSFNVSIGFLNLTLFGFFFVQAFATFFAGPLSDCIGRKPLVIGCMGLYTLASVGCALSPTVEWLVFCRMLQGAGLGGISTLATALIEDAFDSTSVQTAMTFMQSLIIIGPVLAPFLGSFVLMVTNWRGIFALLAVLGALSMIPACLITETHRGVTSGGSEFKRRVANTLTQCKGLIRQRSFVSLALILGMAGVPFFAFIAVVSYILLYVFQLDYIGYSVVYAIACLVDCVAPFAYLFLNKRLTNQRILLWCFALMGVSGVLMLVVGPWSAALFLIAFLPYCLAEGMARPLCFVVLLDQPEDRVGSASALANFSYVLITALATVVATMDWPSLILSLGVITVVSTVVSAVFFLWNHLAK